MTQNGRVPFRHSLAVMLYGGGLRGSLPISAELEDAFTVLLAGLVETGAGSRRKLPARQPTSRKGEDTQT
jgi:hypothetical protein